MSKRKPMDKAEARERRNRMLESAATAKLSLTEGVREMRAIAGMTQEEFARHRGVSARVIKAIELGQGNPTVATMNRIAEEVEGDTVYRSILEAQQAEPEATGADAIAKAAHEISEALNVKAICAWTSSGSTAFRIARERPNSTVIALTPNRATARRLTLVWGVHAIVTKDASDADDMAFRACKFAVREHYAKLGDRVIVVAGVPFGTPGATNMVRIAFVAQEHVAKA